MKPFCTEMFTFLLSYRHPIRHNGRQQHITVVTLTESHYVELEPVKEYSSEYSDSAFKVEDTIVSRR